MIVREYNEVVKEFSNRVCRFADKMLMDKNMAKDITQEAFLRLWENHEMIEVTKAKSWLFTTAYRLCIDHIARQKKYSFSSEIPDRGEDASEPELVSIIQKLVERLPEVQRSILLLRDYEGYNYAEIGTILNLSESKVKVYLFRARNKIKNYIKDLKLVL